MSRLLVKPHGESGELHAVTPQSADWHYVGFAVHKLKVGETISEKTADQECCLVLLTGKATIRTSQEVFEQLGSRMSVFEKIPPFSVYVPNEDEFVVTAETDLEIAICKAPGKGSHKARVITPDQVGTEDRGSGAMSRRVHNILPETEPADSLLVVEVYTEGGNWSSYPPHKHDRDNLPAESYLEETYYHKVNPSQGYVMQRVYNDSRTIDEAIAVPNDHVVLVPEGYHPVGVPAGYESYYLNVMAGPTRVWKFHNDPEHEWLFQPVK